MDYDLKETGGDVLVTMKGRFTFVDREPFGRLVQKISQASGKRCVFDISALDFVDSAGLGMFLMARDAAAGRSMALVLRGPQGHVRRVFDIAKFDTLFTIES